MHRNAPLTAEGRRRLCQLIEEGFTVASAAESMRISRQTAHKWWRRYLAGGTPALEDRSSRPRRSPTKTPAKVERRVVALRRRCQRDRLAWPIKRGYPPPPSMPSGPATGCRGFLTSSAERDARCAGSRPRIRANSSTST